MNKIYVANLSYSISESDLEDRFAQFGSIVSINLIKDRDTGRLRGFGFIEFEASEAAEKACEQDGQELLGRPLKVSLAREQRSQSGGGGGGRRGGTGGGGRQW